MCNSPYHNHRQVLHHGFLFAMLLSIVAITLTGCDIIRKQQQGDVLVEVDGKALYRTDIDALVRGVASPEDSARIADAYIEQWTVDALLYKKAKHAVRDNKHIEALVEDYRRSLYVHTYEEQLVKQDMPKHVAEDSIVAFYEAYPERFILQQNIVKGILLVVPNDAPATRDLRQWLGQLDDDHLELIEKYAYQNASGYELFTDHWQTTQNILLRMPMERDNLTTLLRQQPLIEMTDSTHLYFLRVTDKRLIGEMMPLEYARAEIEQIILAHRQVTFLQENRNKLKKQRFKQ